MEDIKFSSWSELYKIRFTFLRKKFTVECQNIITFDTETSNGFRRPNGNIIGFSHYLAKKKPEFYQQCEPVSIMYIWQVGIESQYGPMAFYGRTWDSFKSFIELLSRVIKYNALYGTSPSECRGNIENEINMACWSYSLCKFKISVPIFVHNLGFDFQGLRNIYDVEFAGKSKKSKRSNVFARSPRKPIYASILTNGIRIKFRDTYSLTHKSLKTWSEDEDLTVKKLNEPKDFYLPIRTPETPLTYEEMQYSAQDVISMIYGIKKYRDKYEELNNIPNTQTGEIRITCVEKIAMANPEWAHLCASVTKSYTKDFFLLLCNAFLGGWTHANALLEGVKLNNVHCFDFASSYPAVMCTRTFPIHKWEQCGESEFDYLVSQDLKSIDLEYHYLLTFSAKNVQVKTDNTFWSSSKCKYSGEVVIDNGKIFFAEYFEATMTDLDFDTFKTVYEFEDIQIKDLYKCKSGLLPKEMVLTILDYYQKKTSLKDVQGKESMYTESKQWVNSIYGVAVTKILSDTILFTKDGWDTLKAETIDDNEFIDMMEKTSDTKTFISYQIGVWVTAWAKHNLWETLQHVDKHVAYGDTDSLKGIFDDEDLKWFKLYNDEITETENKIAAIHGCDPELFCPKTPKGKSKRLGIWEREDDCIEFKTLGAKRYVYTAYDKWGIPRLHATIAGLPKSCATAKIKSVAEFETGISFDTSESGKTIAHYNDNQTPGTWIDRYGKRYYGNDKFGCCLEPTTFDLSISPEYDAFLNALDSGSLTFYENEVQTPSFIK